MTQADALRLRDMILQAALTNEAVETDTNEQERDTQWIFRRLD
jgi:hypothetical protein